MTDKKSALEELYTDSGAFDATHVAMGLKPFIGVQRADHAIYLTGEGHGLKSDDKVLAYALAKKLLQNEGVIENSGVSGKEIHQRTELPKGTVDPTMIKLKKEGFLAGSGSSYEIPVRRIEAVLERLGKYSHDKK